MVKIKLYRYVLYRFNEKHIYEQIYQSLKLQNALKALDNILKIRAEDEGFELYEVFMKNFEGRVKWYQEDGRMLPLSNEDYTTSKNYLWEVHSAQTWLKENTYHHEIETSALGASGETLRATKQRWMLSVTKL